ncbi:MAG: DUF134 domain-containing protein [Chloroflexi bacterium]|nr:DUF134 domain-containing protein [Chloroflexota bacterium]
MPRPIKCRRVAFLPGITYFKPAGIPLRELEENLLTIDEIESIRLRDIEDLDQEQCAVKMDISRATFQRILGSARRKIADALLNGKAIKIQGGAFEVTSLRCKCLNGCDNTTRVNNNEGVQYMKIAVVTDDGTTICQHFGRALYYSVVTVDNGKVVSKEQRNKAGHHIAGDQHASHASHGEKHGFDANAQASHAGMMANITDCQLLIAGGMGWGAQESLKRAGITVHMTDVNNIDEAIQLYIQGKLPNLQERLH